MTLTHTKIGIALLTHLLTPVCLHSVFYDSTDYIKSLFVFHKKKSYGDAHDKAQKVSNLNDGPPTIVDQNLTETFEVKV